jgi:hypothetical protein
LPDGIKDGLKFGLVDRDAWLKLLSICKFTSSPHTLFGIHGPFDFLGSLWVSSLRDSLMWALCMGLFPVNGTTDLTVTVAKRVWRVSYVCLGGLGGRTRMP